MITLRRATMDDAITLYAWRNDSTTRAMFRNSGEVSWREHRAWLRDVFEDLNRILWVAERDSILVGTARLDRNGDEVEVSVTVAPEARGDGVGTEIIRQATAAGLHMPGVNCVVARIKIENTASIRAFAKVGYTEENRTVEEVVMVV